MNTMRPAALVLILLVLTGCAAQRATQRGREALEFQRYDAAVHYFEEALRHQPELRHDAQFMADYDRARFDEAMEQAHLTHQRAQFADALKWLDVARTFRPASPQVASLTHDATRGYVAQLNGHANDLIAKGKLVDAQGQIDFARTLGPGAAALDKTQQRIDRVIAEVDALLDRAGALAGDKQWDAALDTVNQARAMHRQYPRVDAVERQVRVAAAEHFAAQGKSLRLTGAWRKALDQYQVARDYLPIHEGARVGTIIVYKDQAEAAEQANQLGVAWLWYKQAATLNSQQAIHRANRLHTRIIDEVQPIVALDGSHNDPSIAANSAQLIAHIHQHWKALRQPAMSLVPKPDQQPLTVTLHVPRASVSSERISRHEHLHEYIVEHEVPNPRIPELRRALRHARAHLRDVQSRYDRCEHEYHRASRHDDPHSPEYQRKMAHHRRSRDDAHRDLKRAKARVHTLEHELSCEPATILIESTEHWPYVVESYRKQGRVTATYRIQFAGTGPALGQGQATKTQEHIDNQLIGANPRIGLKHDALDLPPDDQVRATLIVQAAADLARDVRDELLRIQARAVLDRAATLRSRGDHTTARELAIRGQMLLLETPDHRAASSAINQIRQSLLGS